MAQKRLAASNPDGGVPLRVAGRLGPAVQLGDETYHLAVLTTAGTEDLETLFGPGMPVVAALDEGASLGKALMEGAQQSRNYVRLDALLQKLILEELPPNITRRSPPDDVVIAVDKAFEQSGLLYLFTLLKNSLAALSNAANTTIQKRVREATTLLEERLDEETASGMERLRASLREPSPAST